MKLSKIFPALLVFFVSSFSIMSCGKSEDKSIKSEAVTLGGTRAEEFTLADYNGEKHSLSDYKGSKAIVIMFISTRCPITNAYNSRMVSVHQDYHSKNITFLGIDANKNENIAEIKEHSKEENFKFTILKDVNNVVADKFGATVTPEIYVLNPDFEILYHGRIDDSMRINDVESQDLRNALDEIIAGKKVSISTTKAFGCTIQKVS